MSTPNVTPAHLKSAAYTADWASGGEPGQKGQSSEDKHKARSGAKVAIAAFSDAMESLNQVATNPGRVSPLMFQFKTSWGEASEQEEVCIDKATEACSLVCDVIAPKARSELFHFYVRLTLLKCINNSSS